MLCCQLSLANEEKSGLRKQVNELIARLKAIEESNKENSKALVDTINDLKDSLEKQSATVKHYRKEIELMRKLFEAKDEVNMMLANGLMKKAATYTKNQWESLRNILKDGTEEISNNLCEQRMKPVKLLLKNCMNIGSEAAAENSAFIFSLIENCKLNDIAPQDYLKHLFECILHGKDCNKKALLPCFYKPVC